MVSEWSFDIEDWRFDAENSALQIGIISIFFKYIKPESNYLKSKNILQSYKFCTVFSIK